MQKIIRVGVMNNFNFTEEEIKALKPFEKQGKLFVNSNSFVTITADYPSIVTVNPYLRFVEPQGDLSNVKACRVKVCSLFDEETKTAINWSIFHNIPVLITFQRWSSVSSAKKFMTEAELRTAYEYNKGWFRIKPEYQKNLEKMINEFASSVIENGRRFVYFCDKAHKGCPSCNNCIRLTYGARAVKDSEVYGLNLNCFNNGKCPFHCPDCFAKRLLMGQAPKTNIVYRNNKQKGNYK